jgi:hypothetical protein
VTALVLLALAAAPSADARWTLRWVAPNECVSPADLARAVEDKLGRAVFGTAPEFTVDGVMRGGTSPRWRAQFTLVDATGAVQGTREVSSDEASCRKLDASLALIVAVMIDPRVALGGAAVAEPTPPPLSVPPPPPGERLPPQPEPPPLHRETPPEPPRAIPRAEAGAEVARPLLHGTRGEVLFGASGTLGLGLSAALGAQITTHVRWGNSAAVEWWVGLMPRNQLDVDGGLAAVHALQTALTLCPLRAEGGPALFALCGGVAGTWMLTYTEGYKQGYAAFLARPDAVARARLRLAFGSFALSLGVMGGIGPVRPQMFVMKPSGNAELVPVGSWGWGAAELAVGTVWK